MTDLQQIYGDVLPSGFEAGDGFPSAHGRSGQIHAKILNQPNPKESRLTRTDFYSMTGGGRNSNFGAKVKRCWSAEHCRLPELER